ncbi:hypothetical protein E2562_021341 [Oryza meyeriana var. granulata]|uniref:Uncharacterized protein n=1 Tax=Oryza meyeriana var. granulata TaxID=110450 RepID=A0A6G1BXP5_9ORYZ|nr:hypothetical protein E2562_021341 [Oryza meyeriana var. granulata]KAF0893092.1 hypothetical protein E2562_021341 [Oryza meyeriana var. granulata]KAF0893093.1 hypothetical protein E2562_021341 [Oryza meyeriana var. granulata]KAF0893094.1 hypothetical protein E2562_021341 [Oryza meyeriana var. granulata]KAF0893095.1 hypothetical protein E2562_021341 [Oryza meyeriana var. granulata]
MAPGLGCSSSMASGSSTTTSTGLAPRRLSAAAPVYNPRAAPASIPGSFPAVAPPPISSRMPSGSSARSNTSFDPAGSSALAPARNRGPELSALAPAFYPTTASSSSTEAVPRVSERLPPIARPTASSPGFPPETKIKGARLELFGFELGLLAEHWRLIQKYTYLKENHLLHNKDIMNAFILEKRLALDWTKMISLGRGSKVSLGTASRPCKLFYVRCIVKESCK